MDCSKVGGLIARLRKEKGLTQKQVADGMNISDKTISKWERGLGCPDVSLLGELSHVLGVNVERILSGDLPSNDTDGGNMKRINFYVCPTCGNILSSTGQAELSCCGRKLSALVARPADQAHQMTVQKVEEDYYIAFHHDMSKQHHLCFTAYVTCDRILMIRQYPEQEAAVRFPQMHDGKLFFYCSQHGLWWAQL